MGQEVKNLLRAQSKYGLMGSSAKTGKKDFCRSQEQFLDKDTPHLYINCSVYVWVRAQGSQIFKQNSIISIHSKVMAFLVILLSPRGPRGPHIVPMSSLPSPHHLHIVPVIPIALRRSPCGPHCPCCPHPCCPRCPYCPHCPHIIPTSSPCRLEGPQIIPNPPDSHPTKSLKMQ